MSDGPDLFNLGNSLHEVYRKTTMISHTRPPMHKVLNISGRRKRLNYDSGTLAIRCSGDRRKIDRK